MLNIFRNLSFQIVQAQIALSSDSFVLAGLKKTLDLAVGGDWGGAQGVDDAIFPQQLVVDYVRVYQWK